MSGGAGLDLRYPIGTLFSVLGLILGAYGLATAGNAEQYERSLSVNINLWWGLVMLVFGVALLLAARRVKHRPDVLPTEESAEGRATERREHELGLER